MPTHHNSKTCPERAATRRREISIQKLVLRRHQGGDEGSSIRNSFAFSPLLALAPLLLLAACASLSPGQTLFLQTCAACHATTGDTVIVGPSLTGIATRADNRVGSLDAREYILQSITDPSAYINPGFKDVMPESFGAYFSDKELQELVEYLMTLK